MNLALNEIQRRLARVFGETAGSELYQSTLTELSLQTLSSPDDEMRFAEVMIQRGGLYESIGRALRVRALLNGASRNAS